MNARPDNLGALPFADYADDCPNRLPWGGSLRYRGCPPCEACNADTGEACRPSCIGEAAHLEGES